MGGEDDLVTVFDYTLKRVIARLQGHNAFVLAVCFHPTCPTRLVSSGEDGFLAFWDFASVVQEDAVRDTLIARDVASDKWSEVPLLAPLSSFALSFVASSVRWHVVSGQACVSAMDKKRAIVNLWKRGADL